MSQKRDEFKKHIDSLRDRNDAHGYNKQSLRCQREGKKFKLQHHKSLSKTHKNYSDKKIRKKFKEIRERIEGAEKAIQSMYRIANLMKNFRRTNNTFLKYNNPEKLSTKVDEFDSSLTSQRRKKLLVKKNETSGT